MGQRTTIRLLGVLYVLHAGQNFQDELTDVGRDPALGIDANADAWECAMAFDFPQLHPMLFLYLVSCYSIGIWPFGHVCASCMGLSRTTSLIVNLEALAVLMLTSK